VVIQPGQCVQADQPVAPAADTFMPAFDELGQVRVRPIRCGSSRPRTAPVCRRR
jgi:hypothetical protein